MVFSTVASATKRHRSVSSFLASTGDTLLWRAHCNSLIYCWKAQARQHGRRTCQHKINHFVRYFASTNADFSQHSQGHQQQHQSHKLGPRTCTQYVVRSPFPDIPSPPYPPIAEFVSSDWQYFGEKIAILDCSTGESRTFKDYSTITSSFASHLLYDFGITDQSTVALFAPNRVDYVPIVVGVGITGAKITPINPLSSSYEVSRILMQSRSELLICDSSNVEVAIEALRECSDSDVSEASRIQTRGLIVVPSADTSNCVPASTISFDELKRHDIPTSKTVDVVHASTDHHTFVLPYSSGTTGLPKGVCLSHANIIANLWQCDVVERPTFPRDYKLISPLPLFHIYGLVVSGLYCAWRGQTIITSSGRYDLEHFCKVVQEHRPQRAHLVPPIILGLTKHPIARKFDLTSLKMIISAAAPMGITLQDEASKALGCQVKQAWGMSELSPIGTICTDALFKRGSVGPPAPSTSGKILCVDSGMSLGPNKSGELLIKGPQVMLGYLDAPDKTAQCLGEDGWLRTGDIGHYDEDGHFFITDRLKELIKVRGFQVAPAELEALLLSHEAIKDAAVIPVKNESAGEVPRAYVVLQDDADPLTESEVQQWVKDRVAPHKRLDGGVVYVDVIPKSSSGKLLRRILREGGSTKK